MEKEIKINEYNFYYFLSEVKKYIDKYNCQDELEEKEYILDYIEKQDEIRILKLERDAHYKFWQVNKSFDSQRIYKEKSARIKELKNY